MVIQDSRDTMGTSEGGTEIRDKREKRPRGNARGGWLMTVVGWLPASQSPVYNLPTQQECNDCALTAFVDSIFVINGANQFISHMHRKMSGCWWLK